MNAHPNDLAELLSAVYRRDGAAVRRLAAAAGALRDADGRTALIHAILASPPDAAIVQLLVDAGADVNVADGAERWTPLHFAARDQSEALVRLLLAAGANVDPLDVFGNTPLWRGVMNAANDPGALKVLVAHGANPHLENAHGVSPAAVAHRRGRADLEALLSGPAH